MTGTGPLGKEPAGRSTSSRRRRAAALYLEPDAQADPGRWSAARSIADSRRAMHAARVRTAADLLLPARGRAQRVPGAQRPAHPLPQEGRRLVLHDPGRRPRGRGRRLVLPGAARRRPADQGPDRVLLRPHGPLVRGGRGDRSSTRATRTTGSTCSAPTATSGSRSTARCWPRADRAMALFESNLPTRWYLPARGRARRARAQRHRDPLPVQGPASYYSVKLGGRTRWQGPGLVLRRAARRGRADRRVCCASSTRRSTSSSTASWRSGPIALEQRRQVRGAAEPVRRPGRLARLACRILRSRSASRSASLVIALPGDPDASRWPASRVSASRSRSVSNACAVGVELPAVELDDQPLARGSRASTR